MNNVNLIFSDLNNRENVLSLPVSRDNIVYAPNIPIHARREDDGPLVHIRSMGSSLLGKTSLLGERQEGEEDILTVGGYGLKWDDKARIYYYTESFTKGAFTECLKKKETRWKIGHNYRNIALANMESNTFDVSEDDDGLIYTARMSAANTESANLYDAVNRGDVSKASIGFSGAKYIVHEPEEDDELTHYEIIEVKRLWEISAVDFPAYDSSSLEARNNEARNSVHNAQVAAELAAFDLEFLNLSH